MLILLTYGGLHDSYCWLGNPGHEYEGSRHNMGFDVIDKFAEDKLGVEIDKKGFKGLYTKVNYRGQQVLLLKPQTYMNLSGQSVVEMVNFFKIKIEDIIVVYDDMDLVPGKIRIRSNGSSGGHNGIKNIIALLGTQEIKRIRVGVGKTDKSVIDFVLGKPSSDDRVLIDAAINKAVNALEDLLVNGFKHTLNCFN